MPGDVYSSCSACGALVVDRPAHALWHARVADLVPTALAAVTTIDPQSGAPTVPDRPGVELVAVQNAEALRQLGLTAITTNSAYLDLLSPTTGQAVAQVRALTAQVRALIRLAVHALDTID